MCLGFQPNYRERILRIKKFYLGLCVSNSCNYPLPDSLTLHYLPRINGSPLEIDELSIRPESPGFVTLYRVVSGDKGGSKVFYGSRENVGVGEGVKFEVLLNEEKMVRGTFRKNEGRAWKLELKCGMEVENVKALEVCVAAEGEVVMTEKVAMVVRRRKGRCFDGLEEIPEEGEGELVEEGCCCCECHGDGYEEVAGGAEVEAELEGMKWAVDVGIWVACLGVGCLVSIASSKKLGRSRIL